jgi:hypothetical protein
MGAFQGLSFKGVDQQARDVYAAAFAHGAVEYRITALTADGKIANLTSRQLP